MIKLKVDDPWRLLALAGAALVASAMIWTLLQPLFTDWTSYGFHDWDSMAAYRYIGVLSIKRFHEGPWWHPYLCGGFPAWAYVEGGSNIVSPYFPLYMALPLPAAMRLEVVGSAITAWVSAYLLASRFTRSVALRALVAVVWALNGRWALQMATGHAWHMQYAWMPLAVYFLDGAFEPGKLKRALYGGVVVALMVYMGGIYPVPHTALALVVYALAAAAGLRSWRPIGAVALTGFFGLGLAAPKLLPLIDLMRRFPRAIESTELLDLRQVLLAMAEPQQSLNSGPVVQSLPYGWHEFGIYVGAMGTAVVIAALFFGRGPRVLPVRVLGAIFFVLGLGAILPVAPWVLLHKVPPFSSQHVPSRFLHPAVLFLSVSFVAAIARRFDSLAARRPWLDVVLMAPLYLAALNIAEVGRKATEHSFYLKAPPVPWTPEFHHEMLPSYNYSPPDAWAGASLLSMYSNRGFIQCYSVPERGEPRGAIAKGAPGYQGEAYVIGTGKAVVTRWTPNSAEIEVDGAQPGDTLVYNMNFDPSWRANGKPAIDHAHAVATRLSGGAERVRFSYYPRALNAGLAVCLASILFAVVGPRAWRRYKERKRRGPEPSGATT